MGMDHRMMLVEALEELQSKDQIGLQNETMDSSSNDAELPEFLSNPMNSSNHSYYVFDDVLVRGSLIIIYSIIFFFCFFGNLAVIAVMTLHWRMRSITKFCLGNLAFANLSVGIFCVYQNLCMYLYSRWVLGDLMCKMYHFTNSLCHMASILILVVISVERYMVILHPFKCRRVITVQRLRLILLGVWILSGLICSPKLYYNSTVTQPMMVPGEGLKLETICTPVHDLYSSHWADLVQFLVTFLIPLGAITVLYIKVGFFLHERQKDESKRVAFVNSTLCKPEEGDEGGPFNSMDEELHGTHPSQAHNSFSLVTMNGDTTCRNINCSALRSKIKAKARSCYHSNSNRSSIISGNLSSSSSSSGKSSNGGRGSLCSACKDVIKPGSSKSGAPYRPASRNRSNSCSKHSSSNSNNSAAESVEHSTIINGARAERMRNTKVQLVQKGPTEQQQESPISTPSCPHAPPTPFNSSEDEPSRSDRPRPTNYCRIKVTSIQHTHKAVVRMLTAVVITFAVCNLPFHVRKLYQNYSPDLDIDSGLTQLIAPFTFILMYTNCALSPILYGFLSKSFRASFKDVLRCRFRKRPAQARRVHLY